MKIIILCIALYEMNKELNWIELKELNIRFRKLPTKLALQNLNCIIQFFIVLWRFLNNVILNSGSKVFPWNSNIVMFANTRPHTHTHTYSLLHYYSVETTVQSGQSVLVWIQLQWVLDVLVCVLLQKVLNYWWSSWFILFSKKNSLVNYQQNFLNV